MISSLSINDISGYTSRQLNYFFPDNDIVDLGDYKDTVKLALDRLEFCYKHVTLKNYFDGSEVVFNHLHSDQYLMYLWFLGNTIWKEKQDSALCNKLYYLNKSLHAFDCMFDTMLPEIFLVFHGAGTMLGKANYGEFFVVLQGCTIGRNRGKYPVLGKGVALTAHCSLIGECNVGDLVTISSYTNIIDKNIGSNNVVFKNNNGITETKKSLNPFAQTFFNVKIETDNI